MTSPTTRRPLPALVFLLALTLLTSLVWWRVMNRDGQTPAPPAAQSTTAAPALPKPTAVSISVLNSTNRKGIAKSAAAALTKQGFVVAGIANDTVGPFAGVAKIRYSADERPAATLLTYYLPGACMIPAASPSQGVLVISLGTKYRAVAGAKAVQAAIAKNRLNGARQQPPPAC